MYLLTTLVQNPWEYGATIWDRINENWWRSGIMIAVIILLVGLLKDNIHKLIIPFSALGGGWLSWQIYNVISPRTDTPLFPGEVGPSGLWELFFGPDWQFAVAIIAAAIAYLVFITSKRNRDKEEIPIIIRILAAIGTWAGITLIVVVMRNVFG